MPQKINAQIVELRWERDFDDMRHAAIAIRHVDGWTALFYEHPSQGWQVTEMVVEKFSDPDTRGKSDRVYLDELTEDNAAEEFERRVGTLANTQPLDQLAGDLYELGRRGANRRWKKRYVTLEVRNG